MSQLQPHAVQNRQRLWWIIASVAAVVVVVAGIVIGLSFAPKNHNETLAILQEKGANITETELATLDKTNLFFALFTHANTQPTTRIIAESYYIAFDPAKPAQTGDTRFMRDITFDYKTKRALRQDQSYTPNTPLHILSNRCFQGVRYNGVSTDGQQVNNWQRQDAAAIDCGDPSGRLPDDKLVSLRPNDGVTTGGLNTTQAEAFTRILKQANVIKVNSVTIASRQHNPYIRLELTLEPQKRENSYWGMQQLLWSFKEAGVDSLTHPYSYLGVGGNGLRAIYYFDPSTQLPVYSIMKTTPAVDENRRPVAHQADIVAQQVYYEYPQALTEKPLEDRAVIRRPDWFGQETL